MDFLAVMMIYLGLATLGLVIAFSIKAGCKEIADSIREPAPQSKVAPSTRGLLRTSPSSGCRKRCAFAPPLMSNLGRQDSTSQACNPQQLLRV